MKPHEIDAAIFLMCNKRQGLTGYRQTGVVAQALPSRAFTIGMCRSR